MYGHPSGCVGGRGDTVTPACPRRLALGHQLGGTGLRQPVKHSGLTLFIALGVSFDPPAQANRSLQLRDPVQAQSLSCTQRQRHPVLSPRDGEPGTPIPGRRWPQALLQAWQLRFAKFQPQSKLSSS